MRSPKEGEKLSAPGTRSGVLGGIFKEGEDPEGETAPLKGSSSYEPVKRLLDLLGATFFLFLFAPLFPPIAFLIKLGSKGPVFFRSERIGRDGKPFKMFKFRTMVEGAAKMGMGTETSKGDRRLTKVGRFLREWSVDELPQLLNVFKGDMSLVGPRPMLPEVAAELKDWQREKLQVRLKVRPGMTGWAQVNGRTAITWEERLRYDIWYVRNMSLGLDLLILLKTIVVVLKREGIYGSDVKVEAFKG